MRSFRTSPNSPAPISGSSPMSNRCRCIPPPTTRWAACPPQFGPRYGETTRRSSLACTRPARWHACLSTVPTGSARTLSWISTCLVAGPVCARGPACGRSATARPATAAGVVRHRDGACPADIDRVRAGGRDPPRATTHDGSQRSGVPDRGVAGASCRGHRSAQAALPARGDHGQGRTPSTPICSKRSNWVSCWTSPRSWSSALALAPSHVVAISVRISRTGTTTRSCGTPWPISTQTALCGSSTCPSFRPATSRQTGSTDGGVRRGRSEQRHRRGRSRSGSGATTPSGTQRHTGSPTTSPRSPPTSSSICCTRIKWEIDGSLTFRRSCGHGVCGSDAMRINGVNRLACKVLVRDLPDEVTIEPIKGLPLLKDLVVDMEPFFDAYRSVLPFLITHGNPPTRERLQSPQDRARFDDTTQMHSLRGLYHVVPRLLDRRFVRRTGGDSQCTSVHLRQPRRGCRRPSGDSQRPRRRVAVPDDVQLHRRLPARHRGHESDPGGKARVALPPGLTTFRAARGHGSPRGEPRYGAASDRGAGPDKRRGHSCRGHARALIRLLGLGGGTHHG